MKIRHKVLFGTTKITPDEVLGAVVCICSFSEESVVVNSFLCNSKPP